MSCTARAVSETLLRRRIGVRGMGTAAGTSGLTVSTGVTGRRVTWLLALSTFVLRLEASARSERRKIRESERESRDLEQGS